jgi:HEAT repeat protein
MGATRFLKTPRPTVLLLLLAAGLPVGCTSTSAHRRNLIAGNARQQLEAVNYLASLQEDGEAGDDFVELMKTVARGKTTRDLARAATFRAMGRHPHPDFLPLLIVGLHDTSFVARYRAAEALGRLGDPRAVDPLIEACAADPHPWVQVRAIIALTLIADRPRTIPALIIVLDEDRHESVRFNASLALSGLTGRPPARSRETWKDWWENEGHIRYPTARPVAPAEKE